MNDQRSFMYGFWFIILAILPLFGQVERWEVISREPFPEGVTFGAVGGYELLRGTVHLAVDPDHPKNGLVTDLRLAKRDSDGKVRYSADFFIVKPAEAGKGNGTLLFDICNRGGPTLLSFNYADYQTARELGPVGDGFLMRHGFTLAGVGWQADVPEGGAFTIKLHAPSLPPETGIEGLVRSDQVFNDPGDTMFLGHWKHIPYEVSDVEDPRTRLTVRETEVGERQTIPRERWRFGKMVDGAFVPSKDAVVLDGGFEIGRIYELVYVSRDPTLVGLSMTAIRDAVSFLRYEEKSPVKVGHTIVFGGSQSGRFLRHFLYQAFNLDTEDRPVFDGMLTSVAGAGRGSFNHRFAQPSRASIPFNTIFYPTDMFPFTGTVQTDPETGNQDGLFQRLAETEALPKLIQVNTSFEYWGRGASLIHTTVDGKKDLPPMPNERIYHVAGSQHFPGALPPSNLAELSVTKIKAKHPMNPVNFLWFEKAMLLALRAWVVDGKQPPPSTLPKISDGSLTPPESLRFPEIPGVSTPKWVYRVRRLDYGPEFAAKGIVANQPPTVGKAYPLLVPQVDEDGNELAGLRLPSVSVPVATFTGWNLRHKDVGAPEQLSDMTGCFLAFPKTRQQRERSGDPRLSLEERYCGREDYLGKYAMAAIDLIQKGYLLEEDLEGMILFAGRLWDATIQAGEEEKRKTD